MIDSDRLAKNQGKDLPALCNDQLSTQANSLQAHWMDITMARAFYHCRIFCSRLYKARQIRYITRPGLSYRFTAPGASENDDISASLSTCMGKEINIDHHPV